MKGKYLPFNLDFDEEKIVARVLCAGWESALLRGDWRRLNPRSRKLLCFRNLRQGGSATFLLAHYLDRAVAGIVDDLHAVGRVGNFRDELFLDQLFQILRIAPFLH